MGSMEMKKSTRTVITFGTYDLFHYGHLRIIERSAAFGDRLVVGVSSDALNYKKKQLYPTINEDQRMAIVAALKCVDEVFLEESLELKKEYCLKYGADVLVMGDDHLNEYNEMLEGVCECEYLARTEGVSSTQIKKHLSSNSVASMDSEYTKGGHTPPGMSPSPSFDNGDSPVSSDDSTIGQSPEEDFMSNPTLTQRRPSDDVLPDGLPAVGEPLAQTSTDAVYSAAGQNLVHSTKQGNVLLAFLVYAHDAYYAWVMQMCTPFCKAMPREITLAGHNLTVFTANIVTYGRGLVSPIVVALAMKYGWLWTAASMVMFHDFLDHLDGVVAKQQALDGRSKGDDGRFGAYIDAQMDKVVFCLCLWSFLCFMDYTSGNAVVNLIVVLTCATLFGLECAIATVRATDYFTAKLAPPTD